MTTRVSGEDRKKLMAQIKAEYEADETVTVRQIAARIGFSYTATRSMLLAAETVMRPGYCHQDVLASLSHVDPYVIACPDCKAQAGDRCWRKNGMRGKQPHMVRLRTAAVQPGGHPVDTACES
jgi:hypothetical protein